MARTNWNGVPRHVLQSEYDQRQRKVADLQRQYDGLDREWKEMDDYYYNNPPRDSLGYIDESRLPVGLQTMPHLMEGIKDQISEIKVEMRAIKQCL